MTLADYVIDDPRAFPKFDAQEMDELKKYASCESYSDGQPIFHAGSPNMAMYVVKSGGIDILNPGNNNEIIVTHGPGQFSGDIDLLTGRPVMVNAVARGQTDVLKVAGGERFREVLNLVPRLSEKLLEAMQARRRMLEGNHVAGIRVIGPANCPLTNEVREFLYKNFVPMNWVDSDSSEGGEIVCGLEKGAGFPIVELSNGVVLTKPTLQDLAQEAGIWRGCPNDQVDIAIVGGGPAGLAAGVYAASEGLKTVIFDCLGPGGQAGASSRIENFIGFPSGLSGTDLATRGVLQLLKFGGKIIAPVHVDRIESGPTENSPLTIYLSCGNHITAGAVLAATGVKWRMLNAQGAKRFERVGVYHACTAVEAVLCNNQPVAVVGGGNSAGQAAMYLAEKCNDRDVHLLIRGPKLELGMSEYLRSRVEAMPNIKVKLNTVLTAVHGERSVEEIVVHTTQPHDGNGRRAAETDPGEDSVLPCKAIFVFIGAEPNTDWMPDGVAKDKDGYVLTGADLVKSGKWPLQNRAPCPLETSIPRLLAGGDLRAGSTKRVGFAVGDGSLAVTCAHFLRSLE